MLSPILLSGDFKWSPLPWILNLISLLLSNQLCIFFGENWDLQTKCHLLHFPSGNPGTRGGSFSPEGLLPSPEGQGQPHLQGLLVKCLHDQHHLLQASGSWCKGQDLPEWDTTKPTGRPLCFASWWPWRSMSKTHFPLSTNILEQSGSVCHGGHSWV